MRLACAGAAALQAIDDSRVLESERGRQRARELIGLALMLSVPASELEHHPRLRALVADRIERSNVLASAIAKRKMVDPSDSAVAEMISLGGVAIPAALAMLHDPRAVPRVYACVLLYYIGAETAADSLTSLFTDERAVDVWDQDYGYGTTVAQTARENTERLRAARSTRFHFTGVMYQACGMFGDFAMPTGSESRSRMGWDEWWGWARQPWEEWWRLWAVHQTPPDRDVWENYLNEFAGFRSWMRDDPEGRTRVTIDGPTGTAGRILKDGVQVAGGSVPLSFVGEPDTALVREREAEGRQGIQSQVTLVTLKMEAWLPDGRHWQQEFGCPGGQNLSFDLLATPRQRNPK